MEDEEGPECGKADFVLLDQVTMEDFMENLKLRWAQGSDPSLSPVGYRRGWADRQDVPPGPGWHRLPRPLAPAHDAFSPLLPGTQTSTQTGGSRITHIGPG